MSDPTALFEVSGASVTPTELSRGPWDPRHCHGGPVSALLARAVEHLSEPGGNIARLTIELTRPVPVWRTLTLSTEVERSGRKVALLAAVLRDGDTEVARVRSLWLRDDDVAVPTESTLGDGDPGMGEAGVGRLERSTWALTDGSAFHSHACEHRFVRGGWLEQGPAEVWIRLTVPVVDGEEPTGVQRVAAAADFGNGVAGALPIEQFTFINPDLTVHLLRPPMGNWIGLRSVSHYGHRGAGLAESALFDAHGRVGRSVQSLLVARR
jgi:hypothetical protein